MKLFGNHIGLGSEYTWCVRRLIACIAIILGECNRICDEDGVVIVMIGGLSILARRGDRLVCGASLSGLIIAGSWPGVLVPVCRWCICWVFLTTFGSVGLLLVVTVGASVTH